MSRRNQPAMLDLYMISLNTAAYSEEFDSSSTSTIPQLALMSMRFSYVEAISRSSTSTELPQWLSELPSLVA